MSHCALNGRMCETNCELQNRVCSNKWNRKNT